MSCSTEQATRELEEHESYPEDQLLQERFEFTPPQAGAVWSALSDRLASLKVQQISLTHAVTSQESFLARFPDEPSDSELLAHHRDRLEQTRAGLAVIESQIADIQPMLVLFGRIAEDA